MSLSDCTKCWDTPCTCGWDYRTWPIKHLEEHIQVLQKVLQFKKHNSHARFSGVCEKDTDDDNRLMNFLYQKER